MTENPHRGEVKVDLAGREVVLRPTFEAMAEIETALGAGLVSVTQRMVAQQYGTREILTVILAGGNAALRPGEKLTRAAVQKAIEERGLFAFSAEVTTFLTNCLTGGAERKEGEPGEAAAAETA